MAEIVEHVHNSEKYHLHIIPTKKFKTITIMIRFLAPLQRETVTERALLPFVLQKGTKNLPSERKLRTKLDELYGAELNLDCSKKGENHLITLRCSFVNEKYLSDHQSLIEEILQLLQEILLKPNTENNAFKSDLISKEKETLRQRIESIKDQKMSYANMRLIDEMCETEAYATHVHGYLEDLDQINEKSLYEAYKSLINNDRMDIYILGDVDSNEITEKIQKNFQFERNEKSIPTQSDFRKDIQDYKEKIEKQKVQQGKLHIGFRTNTTFRDDDYYVLQVFNGLFGGFPHSKLFMNVREKHQLAYYASSRIESHKGLLLVFSGIAPSQFEKAKEIIIEQWEEMKNGNFTEEELNKTKSLTVNQLKETLDHPVGICELMYHQVLGDKTIRPNEMFDAIQKVTKDELIIFSKKLQLDTIYFLTSDGDEE